MVVFARFGYRKTSMDEVAQAAQLSRQGLYLHFSNKDELFRATLHHALGQSMTGGTAALAEKGLSLQEKLLKSFDEWVGRYVGKFSADAMDLMEALDGECRRTCDEQEAIYLDKVAATLKDEGVGAACKKAGITPRQVAETLSLCAEGIKENCETREAFRTRLAISIKVIVGPLV